MAISTNEKPEGTLSIDLSNGHRETLKKIVKDYGLISEKEAIIFLLGVVSQANGKPIEVNGTQYLPSEPLKAPKS